MHQLGVLVSLSSTTTGHIYFSLVTGDEEEYTTITQLTNAIIVNYGKNATQPRTAIAVTGAYIDSGILYIPNYIFISQQNTFETNVLSYNFSSGTHNLNSVTSSFIGIKQDIVIPL